MPSWLFWLTCLAAAGSLATAAWGLVHWLRAQKRERDRLLASRRGPQPPRHVNCRCTMVNAKPYMRGVLILSESDTKVDRPGMSTDEALAEFERAMRGQG